MINRPALRYYGGKWRLASWIISHFPPHDCYVEPFGGAGSVLLQKERSYHEVYNDLDSEVVNFFRVLRERSEELIRLIHLTPFAREEQRESVKAYYDLSDLERARRLYVRLWMSFGATSGDNTGWRYQHSRKNGYSIARQFSEVDHLPEIIDRFRGVQIENDPALKVIERYDKPETLFYVDPPYMPDTRERSTRYTYEMDEGDHVELLDTLASVEGMVILSGYDHPLYHDLGWQYSEVTTRVNSNDSRTEVLWFNAPVSEFLTVQAKSEPQQLEMEMTE